MNTTTILCSAIWIDEEKIYVHQPKNIKNGFVVCGRWHHNCIGLLFELTSKGLLGRVYIQGFLTSDDMFVTREESANIAFDCGQISEETIKLFSEDIY
jgi:hypothetical protein